MSKQRVSLTLAIPVVLACGGIGAAAGWMFPPQVLTGDRARNPIETSDSLPSGTSKDLASPSVSSRAETPAEPPPAATPVEAAAPPIETATSVPETPAVSQVEPAQVSPSVPPEPDVTETSPIKGDGKKQRKHAEQRKRQSSRGGEETSKAHPKEADEPAPRRKSPSVISQIPVLGPVFGLLVP